MCVEQLLAGCFLVTLVGSLGLGLLDEFLAVPGLFTAVVGALAASVIMAATPRPAGVEVVFAGFLVSLAVAGAVGAWTAEGVASRVASTAAGYLALVVLLVVLTNRTELLGSAGTELRGLEEAVVGVAAAVRERVLWAVHLLGLRC